MSIVSTTSHDVLSKLGPPPACWQQALKQSIRGWDELADVLALPGSWSTAMQQASDPFPLFVTREFVSRMRPGDLHDPLLLQVLPQARELQPVLGFGTDPVGDRQAQYAPGLLQKYANRALMVVTGACAVHCRYCFRRHFPYDAVPHDSSAWLPALRQLACSPHIDEVILSGGDPLTLVDARLEELVQLLSEIPHLRRLRIHTRLPIVLPQRVTPTLVDLLSNTRLTTWVVLHANHAQELDTHVGQSLLRLASRGIPLLNQSVLLRGINDDVPTLVALSQRLVDLRVLPYYLHLLDPVAGAAHFDVPAEQAVPLVETMRRQLSGFAVPRLVREVSGHPHKVVLA